MYTKVRDIVGYEIISLLGFVKANDNTFLRPALRLEALPKDRVTVDDIILEGAATGSIVDQSQWPDVYVKVKNKNQFWTKISPYFVSNNVIIEPNNFWAEKGYIYPDGEAEYKLRFNTSSNSSVQFFTNAKAEEDNYAGFLSLFSIILKFVVDIPWSDKVVEEITELLLGSLGKAQSLLLAAKALTNLDIGEFRIHLFAALNEEAQIDLILLIGDLLRKRGYLFRNLSRTAIKKILIVISLGEIIIDGVSYAYYINTRPVGSVTFYSQVQDSPFPPPKPTPLPTSADSAIFLSDITIPDYSSVSPSQLVIKTWQMRNNGSSTWSNSYQLAFINGDQMGAPDAVNVPVTLPGSVVDLSVNLITPNTSGQYYGTWRLRNSNGVYFGDPIWIKIFVE